MLPTSSQPDLETDFAALGLSEASLRVVRELGYAKLTPIQALSLPVLLRGEDLVGQSATGSGKTVAFALPLLDRLQLEDRSLQALVLCPTRELSAQVAAAIRTLGRHRPGLRVLVVSGGQPPGPQRTALADGVHVVVGTPGRVQDHLDRGLEVGKVQTLVLDEADRMLDMGFQASVEKILKALPRQRQTMFFSATFPSSIAAMSKAWQRAPKRVTVADTAREAPAIRQIAHLVSTDDREAALRAVLRGHAPASALVFCNFKVSVRDVTLALSRDGFDVAALHGDLEQNERDRVMAKFRNGSTRVLIATDVAARGLDITGLDAVINYELPPVPDVYVHRIGRTGRAGAPGLAVSLVTPRESGRLAQIEAATGGTIARLPLPAAAAAKVQAAQSVAGMDTLFINGGRRDKLRPGDILGALTGESGLNATDIGRIEIHERFSYVAVSHKIANTVLLRLGGLRIKNRSFRMERVQ